MKIALATPAAALKLENYILIDREKGESFRISEVSKSGGTCVLTSNFANRIPKLYGTHKIARGCRDGRFRLFSLS